jgi:uncharacterized membrane protein YkvA (DUF1232 family)
MAILARFAGLFMLWMVKKWRSRTEPPEAKVINKMSWWAKGQLIWRLTRDKRVSRFARAAALFPALYLISPIDLLPDFIPVIGRLDDALVFSIAIDLLMRSVPAHVLQEHMDALA